jgi:hypothetical protein
LSDNSAKYGGGISIVGQNASATRLYDSYVTDNSASSSGGGIYNASVYAVIITGDHFSGNSPNNMTGGYSGVI